MHQYRGGRLERSPPPDHCHRNAAGNSGTEIGLVRHRVVARDEDFFFAYGFRHREAPGGGFRREL